MPTHTSIRRLPVVPFVAAARVVSLVSVACAVLLGSAVFALLAAPVPALAEEPRLTGGKVILVLIDGASYEEIAASRLPAFERLQQVGSVGLTTVPLGVRPRNASAYATIGSGYTVPSGAAPLEYSVGYDDDEVVSGGEAQTVYLRNMGERPGAAEVLNTEIAALQRAFDAENVNGLPGALGSTLHQAGLKTALVGNADGGLAGLQDRAAMLVAMDSSGTVDYGEVGRSMFIPDGRFPFGVRTDYDRLLEATRRSIRLADFVVVETGDSRRARAEAPYTTRAAAGRARARALAAADRFIAELLPLVDERTLLLVVSPSAPDDMARQGKALAPVFAAGGGFAAGGSLYSPTTRHPGIVAPHDLAPTVLAHLGVDPDVPMIGLPITSKAAASSSASLLSTVTRAGDRHYDRSRVLFIFIMYQVLLLLWLGVPEAQSWLAADSRRWILPYTLGTLSVGMLLEPLIGPRPLIVAVSSIVAISAALAVVLSRVRDPLRALVALTAAATALVALDVALGAPLTRWSFLGYDLVTGGRFYGIGNEFAGVLVGASTVLAAGVVTLAPWHRGVTVGAVAAGLLALVVLFVLPTLGADAGGALSAAVGYGVALYGFAGGRFSWRRLAMLAVVLLGVAVVGLFVANMITASSDGSHVGRFLQRMSAGDFGFVTSTILRKLQANAHLLAVSSWSRLLVISLALCAWLAVNQRTALAASIRRDSALKHGLAGLAAGGIAALAFNDSGVVALATMTPFVVLLLLTMVFRGHARLAEEGS